jgi:hypothetical protein
LIGFKVGDIAAKQVATLATKLRLCQQARMDRKVAGLMVRADQDGPVPWSPEQEMLAPR